MKMELGLFNDSYPPIMDGVALTVQNSAKSLSKTMNVSIITPQSPGVLECQENVELFRYVSIPAFLRPPYRIGLPWLDVKFMNKLRTKVFSIVHAHSPFSAGKLAVYKAKQLNIPLIATFHSKFRDDFLRIVKSKTLADVLIKGIVSFYEKADEVWIPQASVEETIREYGYKGRLVVMDNGVDFPIIQNIAERKRLARTALNMPVEGYNFLFVGQHILEKNLVFLLSSLAALGNFNYKAYFVGQGYAEETLRKLAKQLNIEHKIVFCGTVYDRDVLQDYYLAADLFLFPSRYDNAPLVVREAAASHTPSLMLYGSTASENIIDGINGYLSEETYADYVKNIKRALFDPNYHEVSKNAANMLCRSWDDISREIGDRYQSLIKLKSRPKLQSTTFFKGNLATE